ncbi:CDP-glycerol glycerophosphotransferase family protein [Fictibacillus fluitans]|uniref:CDP-glycerol glycerophosphotransferase family protein n=1 Tax=Fictibacillus fluitans TaxID=3058422 RepID=A0ABT8HZ86_9BACL|nr:CDP-glycerol glycerophosphotransferase family protein [Fictibacillus sp. NE201]MDN4526087.1 CDP-glycerol glycerophosphotransferase family protein [Fictibacillus sp. NE201]
MSFLKLLPTIAVKQFIRVIFFLCSILFPLKMNKVTFASYRADKLTGNLAYVYKEIKRTRKQQYDTFFLLKKFDSSFAGKLDYVLHMIKASYHLATSKYFFIDDYYFPVYCIKPRKGSEIIQLWHAAGAFKKFGYSTIDNSFGPSRNYLEHVKIHSNYTKVAVSSSEVIPFYAEAFDMEEEKIKPWGIPRTDYFFMKDKHAKVLGLFYQKYPQLKNKKLLLYAPTFRGKSHYQDQFECPIQFEALQKMLGDEYALLVHLHPYIKTPVTIEPSVDQFVFEIKQDFTINELMIISDLLITDYSSVIFEYSLLGRPIAFFATDLEEYKSERNFYYDYQSFIPGPFFNDTMRLGKWIKQGEYDYEKVKAFKDRFFDYADGNAAERLVNAILK